MGNKTAYCYSIRFVESRSCLRRRALGIFRRFKMPFRRNVDIALLIATVRLLFYENLQNKVARLSYCVILCQYTKLLRITRLQKITKLMVSLMCQTITERILENF